MPLILVLAFVVLVLAGIDQAHDKAFGRSKPAQTIERAVQPAHAIQPPVGSASRTSQYRDDRIQNMSGTTGHSSMPVDCLSDRPQ